jgi:hypothetical protein
MMVPGAKTVECFAKIAMPALPEPQPVKCLLQDTIRRRQIFLAPNSRPIVNHESGNRNHARDSGAKKNAGVTAGFSLASIRPSTA